MNGWSATMRGYWAITLKEFMHLRRDRAAIMLALVMPIIQLSIFGFAIDFDVRHIATVVVDYDNSSESREYLQKLQATEYINVVKYVHDPAEALDMVRSNEARVAVVIPANYARTVDGGGHPQVSVMLDGSDSQVSLRARLAFVSLSGVSAGTSPGSADVRVLTLFNPTSRTQTYMIPALIAVILQIITVALTAFSIVKEREQGSLEQLMVTPVGRLGLMLGKLTPYLVLAMVEMGVVVFLGKVIFNVQPQGSLLLLFLCTFPFLFGTLALGLFISTFAKTQAQALQFSQLTLLPSILLSGYIAPRDTMPGFLYVISSCLPATYFINITRGIIVRGATFTDIWPSFAALVIIALVLVLVSARRFRKSMS
jgi:ABC-2 type transport system permease protein